MVVIRLARAGSHKRPFYHVTVKDKRAPRDGRHIEKIGYFNPLAKGGEIRMKFDLDRIDYWVSQGAQLSDRVSHLLKAYRKENAQTSQAA